jgi:DNA-binding XRE family transcriptional regulator
MLFNNKYITIYVCNYYCIIYEFGLQYLYRDLESLLINEVFMLIEDVKKVLSQKIADYRKEKKITMKELATRLGVSLRHSYYVRNGVGVTVDDLLRYCEVLKIKIIIK